MYLENITSPADVKKLDKDELILLSDEMRYALLKRAAIHGGHFGPNFGMIEATIALHYVFDSPKDKLVFDVSHQIYPHKMLTGRKDAYLYEEHFDDVSGYSNPDESEHDNFILGHTSTSISLAAGLAKARDLKGESGNVIAVIGDGSLSGGEALEGLNFAKELGGNLIIVVNDNDMSIAENHGGLYTNLRLLRESKGLANENIFKAMGLEYYYVDNGNNISDLIEAFNKIKDCNSAVVVHIRTQKGRGYAPAENDRETWHYTGPFDIDSGKFTYESGEEDYSSITGNYLLNKMKEDKSVVAITAATPGVFAFDEEKRKEAGKQFVDVGIAEETAVALASGIAKNGAKPVFGVISSFIQRAYDQLSQDLCINKSPATILTFMGTLYGMNDITHLGFFDIPLMSNIPNLVYLAPTNKEEYLAMLEWSIEQNEHPVAIKVPTGVPISSGEKITKDFSVLNKYEIKEKGSKIAIIGLGYFYNLAKEAKGEIEKLSSIKATLINPYYISGIDENLLEELKKEHDLVITLEDGCLDGGFGEKISRFYANSNIKVLNFGLKKEFLDRYDYLDIAKKNHLTKEQIANDALSLLNLNK